MDADAGARIAPLPCTRGRGLGEGSPPGGRSLEAAPHPNPLPRRGEGTNPESVEAIRRASRTGSGTGPDRPGAAPVAPVDQVAHVSPRVIAPMPPCRSPRDLPSRSAAARSPGRRPGGSTRSCGSSRPGAWRTSPAARSSVASVAPISPPITARPSGAVCSPPSPRPSAIGIMPAIIAQAGHQDRPQPARPRLRPPPRGTGMPSTRLRSANVTSRIALATATPIAMIAPMNDWMLSVVPREPAARPPRPRRPPGGSARPPATAGSSGSWPPAAGRSPATATPSPAVRPPNSSCIGATCPRTATLTFGGGSPALADRLVDPVAGPAQVLAGHVRAQRQHALHVVAVVFAQHRALGHVGHAAAG